MGQGIRAMFAARARQASSNVGEEVHAPASRWEDNARSTPAGLRALMTGPVSGIAPPLPRRAAAGERTDKRDRVQEAAEGLASVIRNAPTYRKHEWGGFIYQAPGCEVEFSPAMTSEKEDHVDLLPSRLVPKGARVLGWVHSHLPEKNRRDRSRQDDISPGDLEAVRELRRKGIPGLQVDSGLRAYVLDQQTGKLLRFP